jgi:demethylmenaquinone methyltransferase/2-methoxy-6-polyprenyl-1,4-benzoquinol methylase
VEGQRVLDLGCRAGELTLRAARRGALVKGIDVNPYMLKIASENARTAGLARRIEFAEVGVAELDDEKPDNYDAVTAGLCLSELNEAQLTFTLKHVRRMLKPKGLLLVADEVKPTNLIAKAVCLVLRAPLAFLTYILTGRTTHPVADLEGKIARSGLPILSVKTSLLHDFMEIVAWKPEGGPR